MSIALSPIIIVVVLLVLVVILGFIGRARKKKLAEAGPLDAPIEDIEGQSKFVRWFKRLGFAGFMFFLIKGIVWLFIFYFAKESM